MNTQETRLVTQEVSIDEVMKSSEVQEIIAKSMDSAQIQGQEIETYYREGLTSMFQNQNLTLQAFTDVFNQVIDLEQTKKDAKQVLTDYEIDSSSKEITSALQKLDEELNEIGPLFKKIKNALEGAGNLREKIRELFTGSKDASNEVITTTLQGIKGRIDSIDQAFDTYEQQLLLNQTTAEKYIPQLGREIYKTDGMATCLEVIVKKLEHEGTKGFLNTMISQLHTISGIKKGNLQRFILAARMNGNTQLLLRATQFKVFGVMPSLLALNFVLATQKKVHEISDMGDSFLAEMIEQSKGQLDANMLSEVEAKNKLVDQLKKVTDDIDRLDQRVEDHKENLRIAQSALDSYMPLYKEKIEKLDESIFDTNISDSDFLTVSKAITEKMEQQNEELGELPEILQDQQQQ